MSANVPMTTHAQIRLRQRGIRADVLECLVAYGGREHDHAQCEIIYFDSKTIEHVQREIGAQTSQVIHENRDVYAVLNSDGHIVTTGHRFRRILRDKSQSNYRTRSRRSFRAVQAYRARTASIVPVSSEWVSTAS